MTIRLNEMPRIANQGKKRVGRGIGSGKGKTSGKGHKGQGARSGVAIKGFEGGQTPLYMRIPKRGFSNSMFKEKFKVFTTDVIVDFINNGKLPNDITRADLIEYKLIKESEKVKLIMGKEAIEVKFTIEADKASKEATKFLK